MANVLSEQTIQKRYRMLRVALRDKSIRTMAQLAEASGIDYSTLTGFIWKVDANRIISKLLKHRKRRAHGKGTLNKKRGGNQPRKRSDSTIEFAKALYMADASTTLDDIGEFLGGISHQRVSQLLHTKRSNKGASIDPIRIVRELRENDGAISLAVLTRLCGYGPKRKVDVQQCIEALELSEEAERLFASRSPKAKYVAGVRALAAQLGRTPSTSERYAAGYNQSMILRWWSSTEEFWREVGLTPNPVGAKGYRYSALPLDFKTALDT